VNDRELDRLIRSAQPPVARALPPVSPFQVAADELLEEIMSTGTRSAHPDRPDPEQTLGDLVPLPVRRSAIRSWPPRVRWAIAVVAAAAAVVAAVLVPSLLLSSSDSSPDGAGLVVPASPQPSPVLPETDNPYLLLRSDGWTIEYVYESARDEGELRYVGSGAEQALALTWVPAEAFAGRLEDRNADYPPVTGIGLGDGRKAMLYRTSDGFEALILQDGKVFLDIRGTGVPRAEFIRLLGRIEPVEAQEWYAAMPDSMVTPDETAALAQELTANVPMPAGLTVADLESPYTKTFSSFAFGVVQHVSCAWLDSYVQARQAGDRTAMTEATNALGSTADWTAAERTGEADPTGAGDYLPAMRQGRAVEGYQGNLGCGDWAQ